jgi:hypothetical protein
MPLFILFGGELFFTLAALRVAIWVLRGWRDFETGPPSGPPGPQGGLPLVRPQLRRLRGGRTRAAGPLRRARVERHAAPCRKVMASACSRAD